MYVTMSSICSGTYKISLAKLLGSYLLKEIKSMCSYARLRMQTNDT